MNGKSKEDKPASVQEDWQVAYVWGFITKFNLMPKIRRLECLEDFEQCLREPVANRPDDVLEGICVRFLLNLKPTLRDLDCTNIQHQLSKYISDMLKTTEWTVWDAAWSPHDHKLSGCCFTDAERGIDAFSAKLRGGLRAEGGLAERGHLNPLKQMEERGGGLFELDWQERATLLRQLVDWQLTHSETIREKIKEQMAISSAAKRSAEQMEKDALTAIKLEPIGMDRNKKRVWSLDDSARLYQSGNPFKRPCPLVALTTTLAELEAKMNEYAAHGAQPIPKPPKGTGPKGRLTGAQTKAHRALVQGIEHERELAEKIQNTVLPKVENHDKRVLKARRKEYERLANMSAAELRTTRTRRQTKVVNYRDLDEGPDIDVDEPRRGARRGRAEPPAPEPLRPVIPGERRSARQRGHAAEDGSNASEGASASVSAAPSPEDGNDEGARVNGYSHESSEEPIEID